MASLPPLPPRQGPSLPNLPPRATSPSHAPVESHGGRAESSLPTLPPRKLDPSSRPLPSNSSASASGSKHQTQASSAAEPPTLPTRKDLAANHENGGPPSLPPSVGVQQDPPPTQNHPSLINAFGFGRKKADSSATPSQAPMPTLPPRQSSYGAQPVSSQPPAALPPRSSNFPSNILGNQAPKQAGLPQLPNRRTQSSAPPMASASAPPPPLPAHSSATSVTHPSFNAHPPQSSPNGAPPPLPAHSSQPPALPPSHNSSGSMYSNGVSTQPQPSLGPKSAAPKFTVNSGGAKRAPVGPNLQANPPKGAMPSRRYSDLPPPKIDRATQPVQKIEHASSSHSVATMNGSSGLYLGNSGISSSQQQNPMAPSAQRSSRAPLLAADPGPPPPIPPSINNGPVSLSPQQRNTSVSVSSNFNAAQPQQSNGGPPPLPASRPSIAVTGSPNSLRRSRSVERLSVAPQAAPPLARPPTQRVDRSSSLAPAYAASPASSSSSPSPSHDDSHDDKKRGRRRANSDDGFSELVRGLTENQVATGQYTIFVQSPQKQSKHLGQKEYVMMYPIEVHKGGQTWTIFRRYNQFYDLDNDFKSHGLFKKIDAHPDLPPKTGLSKSKKDPILLESRRRAFQQYLTAVCEHQVLAESDNFYMFIQPFQIGDIKPK